MTNVVIDASAGVELALRSNVGRALRSKLSPSSRFWVPEHYFAEVGAALRRLEMTNVYPSARIQIALDRVLSQPNRRVSVRTLVAQAWTRRHNVTLADALYVVVAQHLDAPLVTADLKLASAPVGGHEILRVGGHETAR